MSIGVYGIVLGWNHVKWGGMTTLNQEFKASANLSVDVRYFSRIRLPITEKVSLI